MKKVITMHLLFYFPTEQQKLHQETVTVWDLRSTVLNITHWDAETTAHPGCFTIEQGNRETAPCRLWPAIQIFLKKKNKRKKKK